MGMVQRVRYKGYSGYMWVRTTVPPYPPCTLPTLPLYRTHRIRLYRTPVLYPISLAICAPLPRRNYFLRAIPTLKHYSDTVSGIPSGSMAYLFGHSIWHSFCHLINYFDFDILSDILPGISSDMLSGIDILSGIFWGIHFGILSGI